MSSAATPPAPDIEVRFLRHRLGSFLAIAPLALWVVNHLWNNLAVFTGPSSWQSSVTLYPHPVALWASSFVALAPLLIHLVWGLARMRSARPNLGHYSNYENLKYVLQRLSALGILLFLGAHIWLAFLSPRLTEGHPELFADFAHEMHSNLATLPVYLLGTLGVAYHLGNGVGSVAMSWGLAESAKGLRRYDYLAITVFLIVLAMAWGAIYGLFLAGAAA